MADFFVPANLFQGQACAESPGVGAAIGDIAIMNILGFPGIDWAPTNVQDDGGINHMSLGVLASKEAFLRLGAGAVKVLIPVQGAQPVVIDQCCYAAPMASGNFYILPNDVGFGPGQVQTDPAFWSRAVLRPHPSVFVRNATFNRGVASALPGPTEAGQTNTASPSVEVWTVDTQPQWSAWCLIVDGQAQSVIFDHVDARGNRVDVRRPRDIYQQIVVPELNRRIAQKEPLPLYAPDADGNLVQRGFISRLQYVSYARFQLFNPGTQRTPLFIPSDGPFPPGGPTPGGPTPGGPTPGGPTPGGPTPGGPTPGGPRPGGPTPGGPTP